MIRRAHQKGDAASEAIYSDCERYRYTLDRVWSGGRRLAFVMLNPSTATETANDPTVERCERRARVMGFGAMRVVNLFAFRATDPRQLRQVHDPVGPDNDAGLELAAHWADVILCGWGGHGGLLARDAVVTRLLRASGRPLWHLGLTQKAQPKHPLYISYALDPVEWV